MAKIPYTRSEKKETKYTIHQAFNIARMRLSNRPVCTNAVRGRSYDTRITLVELNELVDQLVDDTRYYG